MTKYEYNLCFEDGMVSSGIRSTSFSLKELQEFVGGRIEILPVKVPGKQGFENVYVVSEDGIYKHKPNIRFPQFYGPVLIANKNLIK